MKKIFLSCLMLFTLLFMTNAVMACDSSCKCGCQQGAPCTCAKEAKTTPNCGCKEGKPCQCEDCKCEDCQCAKKCDCKCEGCTEGACEKCQCDDCKCENCKCTKKCDCKCEGCAEGTCDKCQCEDCKCENCKCKENACKEECTNKCETKKSFFSFFKKDKNECTKKGCPVEQKQEVIEPVAEQPAAEKAADQPIVIPEQTADKQPAPVQAE